MKGPATFNRPVSLTPEGYNRLKQQQQQLVQQKLPVGTSVAQIQQASQVGLSNIVHNVVGLAMSCCKKCISLFYGYENISMCLLYIESIATLHSSTQKCIIWACPFVKCVKSVFTSDTTCLLQILTGSHLQQVGQGLKVTMAQGAGATLVKTVTAQAGVTIPVSNVSINVSVPPKPGVGKLSLGLI